MEIQEILDEFCDYNNPKIIKFESVEEAEKRIRPLVQVTPCDISHMSKMYNMEIWLKKEFMIYTGAFKERGASNALLCLTDDQKTKGVCVASWGNHAQGVAHVGQQLQIPISVFMPKSAPLIKINNCKKFGANVFANFKDLTDAKYAAQKRAQETGALYLNGFDHPDVVAGQGSVGIEILQQLPSVDVIVCPIGGGSLIAGVSVAVKTLKPDCKIIGVETDQTASFNNAIIQGKPVDTELGKTLADGLAVPKVGANTFATAHKLIDKLVVVTEDEISLAILRLAELEKAVVDGSGAAPLAAILSGQLNEFQNKTVALVISGGNIETRILSKCFTRGMIAEGRLFRFTATIDDALGSLSELCLFLDSIEVHIKSVKLDRVFQRADVFRLDVYMVCETRDEEHIIYAREQLKSKFETVNFFDSDKRSKILLPLLKPKSETSIKCQTCITTECPGCK